MNLCYAFAVIQMNIVSQRTSGELMKSKYRATPSKSRRAKTSLALAAAALPAVCGAGSAFAGSTAYGPTGWANGDTTPRYISGYGTQTVDATQCSTAVSAEVRLDVVGKPDISSGTKTISCGSSQTYYGSYNSELVAYRGYFVQTHSSWYGTYTIKYPDPQN